VAESPYTSMAGWLFTLASVLGLCGIGLAVADGGKTVIIILVVLSAVLFVGGWIAEAVDRSMGED